ncbi:DNA circularization N-terminal domain-containing protein [Pectobacterium aroidearum]|uniref:DNA circularization protein n=1 Tax=Pectobacterium aroidearum TaxID=1201031 RepID=UPI002113CF17|nr:DNA circularization N-terminal domain-containing protein [Pectobacterium aroidearum]UUE37973.1 DNA circularization N-terminal domain-containing protein [Pectobacterium aroidearum]UUE42348.1 DNA circularization N-terminal domain-containing protein [Pectobacterium aroidearum]
MPLVHDALQSVLGGTGNKWRWENHLHQASFRGVPFAVVAADGAFGRRQALHEYPYRDSAWVEDIGRSTRKMTLNGFLIQGSAKYNAPDVIKQRESLIAACETLGSGTLIHPTLGELTVSIPEGGLRISESMDSGRIFEFSLTIIESGLKVFAITGNSAAATLVKDGFLKTVSTAALTFIAQVKGEMRSATQAIKTIKNVANFWVNMVNSTVSEVTNLGNTLRSTFGSERYGRYNRGNTDSDNYQSLTNQVMAQGVVDRESILEKTNDVRNASSIEGFADAVNAAVVAILNSSGGLEDRVRALENLTTLSDSTLYATEADRNVSDSAVIFIMVLCTAAMVSAAVEYNPSSSDEATALQNRVCEKLDDALVNVGNRGEDDVYAQLLELRKSFIDAMRIKSGTLASVMQVTVPKTLPSLTLANRLYQDATRSDELIQETNPRHPAFMPTTFTALRK